MKNKLSFIILTVMITFFILSINVYAADLNLALYTSETLEETFISENITGYDLTNYDQNDTNRVTIYVFRKNGCLNCKNFFNYTVAQNLLPNHGEKFRIVSYEAQTGANFSLMNKIQNYLLGSSTTTVTTPYIIIGDKIFSGYIDSTKQQEIENTIISLYNSDKYDVLEDMQQNEKNFYNNSTNITMKSKKGINKNYILKTVGIDRTTENYIDTYEYINAFDIYVADNTDNEVQLPDGEYKISIPVSVTYEMYKVAHIKNGNLETLDAQYNNGYVEFTTTNFSDFVVYGKNNVNTDIPNTTPDVVPEEPSKPEEPIIIQNNGEKNPNTFDKIDAYVTIFIIGMITLIVSTKYIKRK